MTAGKRYGAHAAAIVLLGLSTLVNGLQAQTPDGPPPGAPPGMSNAIATTTLHADYPGNVTAEFEVAYANPPGYRPLTLDIYQVKGQVKSSSNARKPALIWLHGGGWLGGSSRMSYGVIGSLDQVMAKTAARGYVAFAINYRLSSEAKFPAQIEDVKAAIRWIRANADKYHVDPQRIAIGGDSAGGYLATLAGTSCSAKALEGALGNQNQSSCVQAVVDWYGVVSFKSLLTQGKAATESPESKLLGCDVAKCSADLLKQADPLTYISTNTPPFLIMHGQADTVVPVQQSQELNDALKAKGVASQLVLLPGLNHVFIGAKPEQVPDLLDTVFKFLDSTVGAKK